MEPTINNLIKSGTYYKIPCATLEYYKESASQQDSCKYKQWHASGCCFNCTYFS